MLTRWLGGSASRGGLAAASAVQLTRGPLSPSGGLLFFATAAAAPPSSSQSLATATRPPRRGLVPYVSERATTKTPSVKGPPPTASLVDLLEIPEPPPRLRAVEGMAGFPGEPEAKAKLLNMKTSVNKLKLVCDLVRGRHLATAMAQLQFSSKRVAREVRMVLLQAAHNGVNTYKMNADHLYVAAISCGKGLQRKKIWFQGRGRLSFKTLYRTHLWVTLREVPPDITAGTYKKNNWAERKFQKLRRMQPWGWSIEDLAGETDSEAQENGGETKRATSTSKTEAA